MQTRIPAPPHVNFHHPHIQQGVPFEEYETPPRLRRSGPSGGAVPMGGPMNNHRVNSRPHFVQQRQILNGRGIMGQGPKPHRTDHIRIQTQYTPPM